MRNRGKLAAVAALIAGVALAMPLRAETTDDARAWLERLAKVAQSSPIKARMTGSMDMATFFQAMAEAGLESEEGANGMKVALDADMLTHGPRRMNIKMHMTMTGLAGMPGAPADGKFDMDMLQVADGETMWMEMTNPALGGKMVMKIGLDQLEKMSKDMAEKLGLGAGFSFGDPVAQIRMMTEMMDCRVASIADGEVTLAAKLDWEAMRGLLGGVEESDMTQEEAAKILEVLGSFQFVLDEKSATPKRVVMGDKVKLMTMEFPEYRAIGENEIPGDAFSYTPPEGAQVMDLGMMFGAMQQSEE